MHDDDATVATPAQDDYVALTALFRKQLVENARKYLKRPENLIGFIEMTQLLLNLEQDALCFDTDVASRRETPAFEE